ncbi:MAG: diacylglycerol/lipid kinase family protein, partial [Dehalococcoidia bacterium]
MATALRWAVIANPVAGRGRGTKLGGQVSRLLRRAGMDVDPLWTSRPGDGERLASLAVKEGAQGLLVCGGDGTLHEVVNGLYHSSEHPEEVPLGIAPAGRCNDFRGCLGLPKDPERIVDAVVDGAVRRVDLGRIGDRYFATVATLGFDSAVGQYVADGRSPFFLSGTPAYLYSLFVQLLSYRDVRVKLKGDSVDFEGDVFLAATGNTPSYGGKMKI